jgi:hypothetical protein
MKLPPSVSEIAEVIGDAKAMELIGKLPRHEGRQRRERTCRRQGGHLEFKRTRVMLYVPATLKEDHMLVRLIGWDSALKLVQAFGGEVLKPATCAEVYRRFRDTSIRNMTAEGGWTVEQLAEIMGVSVRHVRNVQREINPVESPRVKLEHPGFPGFKVSA